MLDATRGLVDPNRMSDYYDLPRKDVDLAAAMGEIAKAQDIVGYLDSRNPDNPQFRALVTALAKARAAAPKADDRHSRAAPSSVRAAATRRCRR